jgi:hypothetical protein
MLIFNVSKQLYALLFGVLFSICEPAECNAQNKPDEAKAILKERRELLSEAAEQMTTLYIGLRNNVTMSELIQVDRDSLKADLDWFDTPEDRIKAIEKHKAVANTVLKVAKAKKEAGRELGYVELLAKAYVLEIQLELLNEQEKQKAKPGK